MPTAVSRDAVTTVPGQQRSMRVLRPLLMLLGTAVIVVAAGRFWLGGGAGFSTDDAYVRAAKLAVSTDVSGIVSQVLVHEGQAVKRGELLFRLDAAPFQHAVDSARAALDATALSMEAEKRDYRRMLSATGARQAQVSSDEADLARFTPLVKSGAVTRAEYDQARFKLQADQQMAASMDTQSRVQLARIDNNPNVDVRATPEYREQAAKLAEAERQLAHTEVRAPFDGIVTDVESLQPGQYLAAASAAFGLVSNTDIWVEGFPKETQLTWAKPGDPATVTVDTYPDHEWHGVLESLSPASGSSFSVLPAQNANGNWVKVVQRIPIRVRLKLEPGDPPLRDGMSVDVSVDTGHQRSWRDLF
ncbi:MAG TPA: HlyD family secretion protein [Acetobacteraceae bacterium]|nr:HlyD family secretion protein [Acetobacteraceae bacterium]